MTLQTTIHFLSRMYYRLFGPFQGRSAWRTAFRTLCFTVFLVLLGMSSSPTHVCAASEAEAASAAATPYTLPLKIGEKTVTLAVEMQSTGWRLGAATSAQPEVYPLRQRTVITIPLYAPQEAASAAASPAGTLTLTADQIGGNAVLYLQSNAACNLCAVLSADTSHPLTIRSVKYGAKAVSGPQTTVPGTPCDPDTAYYIETPGFYLYTSRLTGLTPLGSTVYACTKPQEGVTITHTPTSTSVSIPLHGAASIQPAATAVLTSGALANWGSPLASSAALTLDASSNNFRLLPDGVHLFEPPNYLPHLQNSTQPHIYLSAAAWMLGPCADPGSGAAFDTIGKSILYTYLCRVNRMGFIPTPPSSTWLSESYGIGSGFYDTRFNFDTIRRLLYADSVWEDPQIALKIHKMLYFYLEYADATAFTANGLSYVPDYGLPAPDSLKRAKVSPSCSLNHYLTEGAMLVRAGRLYMKPQYIDRGLKILDTIEKSASRWIRPNGDLWYAIRPDGTMEKGDYIDVTYSDLCSTLALLDKMGLSDKYPGICSLYTSKRGWLLRNGYANIAAKYSPETAGTPVDEAEESAAMSQPTPQIALDLFYPLLTTEIQKILEQHNAAAP